MCMAVEMTGTIMSALPDAKRIVFHHDPFLPGQRSDITATKGQAFVDGLEQRVEGGFVCRVVVASDQDDPFTRQTLADRARMPGART